MPKNLGKVMSHFDLVTEVNILGLELVFQCFYFRKGRPKFESPLLHLLFKFVMGFLQRVIHLPALGDVHHYDNNTDGAFMISKWVCAQQKGKKLVIPMLEIDLNRVKELATHCREKDKGRPVRIEEVECLVKRLKKWASAEEPVGRLTCTEDTALGSQRTNISAA